MLVLDRDAAVEQWRRAEARIYPSVMVNAELYQQYIGVVRAVASELLDVKTEDDLVAAWHERRELVREVVSRSAPPMLALMDQGAVFDAAFCHRHRELTREQGKALAAARLERARVDGASVPVRSSGRAPFGSSPVRLLLHRLSVCRSASIRRTPGNPREELCLHRRCRPRDTDTRSRGLACLGPARACGSAYFMIQVAAEWPRQRIPVVQASGSRGWSRSRGCAASPPCSTSCRSPPPPPAAPRRSRR